MGHLHRCQSYADQMIRKGYSVQWVVRGDHLAQQFVESKGGLYVDWCVDLPLVSGKLAIVDSYYADESVLEKISIRHERVLFVDDFMRVNYPKGWIVNGVPGSEHWLYPQALEFLLLGPSYQGLRDTFSKRQTRVISAQVQNILIIMGGTDAREMTPLAVKIAKSEFPTAKLCAVVPMDSQRKVWQELDETVEWLPGLNADQILEKMLWADLAISGAGQTLFETCCCGLPTVAIAVAENQQYNFQGFAPIVQMAGWWNDCELELKLRESLNRVRSQEHRTLQSNQGQKMVDGLGVHRTLESLSSWSFQLLLRRAKSQDSAVIWQLSNSPSVRQFSLNTSDIPWDSHQQWYANKLQDPQCLFLVAEDFEGNFLGQIRYQIDGAQAIVSISLGEICRGKGLAAKIIREADTIFFDSYEHFYIRAEISPNNLASQKAFLAAGYQKTSQFRTIQGQNFEFYHKFRPIPV